MRKECRRQIRSSVLSNLCNLRNLWMKPGGLYLLALAGSQQLCVDLGDGVGRFRFHSDDAYANLGLFHVVNRGSDSEAQARSGALELQVGDALAHIELDVSLGGLVQGIGQLGSDFPNTRKNQG